MDTTKLKKFAQAARNLLIDQVRSKLDLVLDSASPVRREHPNAMMYLDAAIEREGKTQVIEQVSYTWFNRFTALRFMDANGYTSVGIVSPAEGQTRPEILAEAMAGNLPEDAPSNIALLLDERSPSSDPQGEAYRLLLVHACNGWHGAMPFLFEAIDDYTECLMPEDLLSQTSILAMLREVITKETCKDVEIIGWLYQFYISEKKDQIYTDIKKNKKIAAENIPAATQLFTPHWIVRYLVENSVGRLWMLNRPSSRLIERMDFYINPEKPETNFLVIARPEDIRICDPAAGSGHMLTYAFDLLHAIYEEEGYDATEIPSLILKYNLTGVEIDDRAGALAAFALAMKAAGKLGRRRFLRMEARPKIVVLQNVIFTPTEIQEVIAVVGKDLFTKEIQRTLIQFEHAKNFGSLIMPNPCDIAGVLKAVEAKMFSSGLLQHPLLERAATVLQMADVLSPKYHVVVANPPYKKIVDLNIELQNYLKGVFPNGKHDLYQAFIFRNLQLCQASGSVAMITMESWMFSASFTKMRTHLLSKCAIRGMAQLGERAFDSIGGAVVTTTAFILGRGAEAMLRGDFLRLTEGQNEAEKEADIRNVAIGKNTDLKFNVSADQFEKIPGNPIIYWITEVVRDSFARNQPISNFLEAREGLTTGNNATFIREWHEVGQSEVGFDISGNDEARESGKRWFPYMKGGGSRRWYGNMEHFVNWFDDGVELRNFKDEQNRVRSHGYNGDYGFREGLTWSRISSSNFAIRLVPKGYMFDSAGPMGFAQDSKLKVPIQGFLNSCISSFLLHMLAPKLRYQLAHVLSLPFRYVNEAKLISCVNGAISVAKSDWNSYETSWEFATLPLLSSDHKDKTLEASYTRLRAHWRKMTSKMQQLEEENNRIFIDAYDFADELTADVPIKEITLSCNPAYRYGVRGSDEDRESRLRADTIGEFLSYAVGCMFGRYSLDAPGLILANQSERLENYIARVPKSRFVPTSNNIIPVLDSDWFPDDIEERFRMFLRITFGEAHFHKNLHYIEECLGKDIRKYFTKDFYTAHVKRYKKRPIYWMLSSPNGSFRALFYIHRYQRDTVSVLLNDYLRELISKLEAERGRLEKLSDDTSVSQGLRTKALRNIADLAKQIDELTEWERDVVFPLAQAQIEINLNDGVKVNYRKFDSALKKIPGLEASDD